MCVKNCDTLQLVKDYDLDDSANFSLYSSVRAVYAKLGSNSEPERARVCQRVAVRASESQSGSHREPWRARERQGEIQ